MIKVTQRDVRCPSCNKKFFFINKIFGIIDIEIKCGRCGKLVRYATPMPTVITQDTSLERNSQNAFEQ